MSKLENFESERGKSGFGARILAAVAGLALVLSVASGSLLAFPALAKQIPGLPIVQDIESLEAENREMREEIDRLKIEIKEIKGTEIRVVESAKSTLSDEENLQIQGLVMDFIRAQYAGDLERMKSLSTPEFAERIDKNPSEFLREKSGEVAFGSITNVGREGDDLWVFVRISDSKTFVDSEYQENFMLKKVGDLFLIDTMEMDA